MSVDQDYLGARGASRLGCGRENGPNGEKEGKGTGGEEKKLDDRNLRL